MLETTTLDRIDLVCVLSTELVKIDNRSLVSNLVHQVHSEVMGY